MTKTKEICTNTSAVINGITVNIHGGGMPLSEMRQYVKHYTGKYKDKRIKSLDITLVRGGMVDVDIHFKPVPFERIRRITGYLVGTLDRFNDAKRAEEHDRVKHTLSE